jgi:hypothetical protein
MVLNNGKSTSEIAYEVAKRKVRELEELLSRQRKVDEDKRTMPSRGPRQELVDRHVDGEVVLL